MVWTYGGDPTADPKDEVRFLVGDTDAEDPLVQDGEIVYYLALFPKPAGKPAWLAAAQVADAIAAKFARKMDTAVGALQASAKQQHDHYVELADRLRLAYNTDGLGEDGRSIFSKVVPGSPVLSGGGRTYLGDADLTSGTPEFR